MTVVGETIKVKVSMKTSAADQQVQQRKASANTTLNIDVVPLVPLRESAQNVTCEAKADTFLVDLMYMLSGVYNVSTTIPKWKRVIWNVYPAMAQIFAFGLLIFIWTQGYSSLALRLSQTSLYLMNLSAFYSFYVSNKSGISIQSIPKNVIRFAFFMGTTFTFVLEAVYIVSYVLVQDQKALLMLDLHLVLSVPVFAFQTIMIGLHMCQYDQIVSAKYNELDAIEEKNDAKMLHKRLVETRDECFLYFKRHIAFPFIPFFCFSTALIVFNLIAIYLPRTEESGDVNLKIITLILEILYPTVASK